MRTILGISCAVVVCGASCAGSISGEVDGDSVPGFTTSALGALEVDGTDSLGLFAYFASAGEACALLAQDFEIMADEDDPEDEAKKREDLYKEGTPEEFWYALISISADDGDDLEDEQEIDLEDFDEDIRAGFTVCHRDEYPEEKDGFLDIDDECFFAEDGVLTAKYTPEDALDLGTEKELDLNDDDGDSAGEITFSGRARYCEAFSDALDDAYNQQPAGPPEG